MTLRRRNRALGIATFALLTAGILVASGACSLVVGAGDDHVASGGGPDATAEAGPEAAAHEAACPGAPEASAACVPVTTMTLPQGGAECPDDSSTCYPHDTSGLSPTWTPTMGPHLGVCTTTQISDFFNACEGASSTTMDCDTWKQDPANAACSGCLYTSSSASTYGAIVYYTNNQLDQVNTSGCIALAEPCNQPCAAAMLAQLECENASCNSPYCTNFTDYQTCSGAADTCSACQQLVSVASNCQTELTNFPSQHPAVNACNLNGATFQDFFDAVALFICGC
jgi:hypothetical protein